MTKTPTVSFGLSAHDLARLKALTRLLCIKGASHQQMAKALLILMLDQLGKELPDLGGLPTRRYYKSGPLAVLNERGQKLLATPAPAPLPAHPSDLCVACGVTLDKMGDSPMLCAECGATFEDTPVYTHCNKCGDALNDLEDDYWLCRECDIEVHGADDDTPEPEPQAD